MEVPQLFVLFESLQGTEMNRGQNQLDVSDGLVINGEEDLVSRKDDCGGEAAAGIDAESIPRVLLT